MKLTRRAAAWFFYVDCGSRFGAADCVAEETTAFPLQYEVLQEINEDKTEATISLEFTETETVQLEKVTLPDGTEKTEDLTVITYTVSVNENMILR